MHCTALRCTLLYTSRILSVLLSEWSISLICYFNRRHIEDFLNKEEGQRYNDMIQRKIQNMVEKRDTEEKIEIAEKQLEALSFEILV